MVEAGVAGGLWGRRKRSVAGGLRAGDGLRTLRRVWRVLRNLVGEAAEGANWIGGGEES